MDNDRKSSADYLNGAINFGQNAYKAGKMFAKGARIVAAGEEAATLAATSEIWGPILIVLSIIIIFTLLILMGGQAKSATPTQTSISPNNQPLGQTTCASGDLRSCLLNDFNINASSQFTEDEIQQIYNAFSLVFQYPKYQEIWKKGGQLKLLRALPPIWNGKDPGTCTGEAVDASETMYLWNMNKCGFYTGNAYLIIHETGHILSGRDNDLFNSFNYSDLAGKDGSACYKYYQAQANCQTDSYLKTYIGPGCLVKDEDFAEGVADYILYKTWTPAGNSLTDFPNQCKNTYDWFANHVFGGGKL